VIWLRRHIFDAVTERERTTHSSRRTSSPPCSTNPRWFARPLRPTLECRSAQVVERCGRKETAGAGSILPKRGSTGRTPWQRGHREVRVPPHVRHRPCSAIPREGLRLPALGACAGIKSNDSLSSLAIFFLDWSNPTDIVRIGRADRCDLRKGRRNSLAPRVCDA
jgi:hypothetical protein